MPVVRNQTFVHIMDWLKLASSDNGVDSKVFPLVKDVVLAGITDIWSAIRNTCVAKLSKLLELFTMLQVEEFYQSLVKVARSQMKIFLLATWYMQINLGRGGGEGGGAWIHVKLWNLSHQRVTTLFTLPLCSWCVMRRKRKRSMITDNGLCWIQYTCSVLITFACFSIIDLSGKGNILAGQRGSSDVWVLKIIAFFFTHHMHWLHYFWDHNIFFG